MAENAETMADSLPVTKVYFEQLDAPDRVEGIARLMFRRGRLTPHVLILCPDPGFMAKLDERLWTVHPESFLAHGIAGEDTTENAEHPILLALDVCCDNRPEVLINGSCEIPPDLTGFSSVVDFVDAWNEPLLHASRDRFRSYRQLDMNPQYLGVKNTEPQRH